MKASKHLSGLGLFLLGAASVLYSEACDVARLLELPWDWEGHRDVYVK